MAATRTIMIVNPNMTRSMTDDVLGQAAVVAAPSTRLIGSTATSGVPSIETNADEVHGALAVLEQVHAGEAQGVDGYVIACFGDTGLAGARETAAGPVVGMTEAALYTAALLGARASIITLPPRTREQSWRALRETGMAQRVSVRVIDADVAEVAADSGALLDALVAEGRKAITDDAAEVIVLGCAGLSDVAAALQTALGAPVVDGVLAAVTMVEGLLAQGLATSRLSTYAHAAPAGEVAS